MQTVSAEGAPATGSEAESRATGSRLFCTLCEFGGRSRHTEITTNSFKTNSLQESNSENARGSSKTLLPPGAYSTTSGGGSPGGVRGTVLKKAVGPAVYVVASAAPAAAAAAAAGRRSPLIGCPAVKPAVHSTSQRPATPPGTGSPLQWLAGASRGCPCPRRPSSGPAASSRARAPGKAVIQNKRGSEPCWNTCVATVPRIEEACARPDEKHPPDQPMLAASSSHAQRAASSIMAGAPLPAPPQRCASNNSAGAGAAAATGARSQAPRLPAPSCRCGGAAP